MTGTAPLLNTDWTLDEARTRRYPAYPAYKPSGVYWLGLMPAHWEIKRLKFISHINPNFSESKAISEADEVSFVPMDAVKEYGGLRLDETRTIADVRTGFTYFRNGDVLIAKITPCFENGKGSIAHDLIRGIAFGTTELHIVRPAPNLHSRFLFYLTISQVFRKLGASEMYGAGGQKRVPTDFVRDFRTPLPPANEQQFIADFLDKQTKKIDDLISAKRELLALLKEKRQAVITHAVTKGLDPNAKLKPSGIEWLGDVPEHWTMRRIKHLTGIHRGKFTHRPRNDPLMYDGPYPFIQTGDVASAEKYIREYHQTLSDEGFAVSKLFPRGTLVMTIAANIGDVAVLDFEACFPDSIVGFVPSSDLNIDYLYYLFIGIKPALTSTATLNTQLNLNIDRIGSLMAIVPPLTEQSKIVEYLESKLKWIEAVATDASAAIERLSEYRTALISAAVTGKIDVRNEVDHGAA